MTESLKSESWGTKGRSILANRRRTVDERLIRHDAALAEILALRQAVQQKKRHD